jgi:hypothetical protein
MKTNKIVCKPLMVDRDKGVLAVWNTKNKRYTKMSFELIEDIFDIIHDRENWPGVEYKSIKI